MGAFDVSRRQRYLIAVFAAVLVLGCSLLAVGYLWFRPGPATVAQVTTALAVVTAGVSACAFVARWAARPSSGGQAEGEGVAGDRVDRSHGLSVVDITLSPETKNWRESKEPLLLSGQRIDPRGQDARWIFHSTTFDQKVDLPLIATGLNRGTGAVVISRLGIEVVAARNVWYSGKYYGIAPEAVEVRISGAYDISLPDSNEVRDRIDELLQADPDETDLWWEIGGISSLPLPAPLYLEANAPFRFVLNIKQFDQGMSTHSILRIWLATSNGEVWSDEFAVVFGR
jgi:hypothetical protein